MLSTNFSYEELTASATATRLGIDNSPPPDIMPHLVVLANGLEQIRRVLGHSLISHSGYRCEALERVLTAKDFATRGLSWPDYFALKAHPKGYADDFICPAFGTPAEIVRVVKASGIKFDQLIVEGQTATSGGWCHASFDPQMRQEVLVATFVNGTPTYQGA
jgi:zinc D-Ala-D-Ala carboxypeptidase